MKVLIAAGGTGGHIYPGIAISDRLKKERPDTDILFVGSYVGMEKNIVPKKGYNLEYVRARGFEKGFSKETLEAVKGIFDSTLDVYRLLKKEEPDLVISTGGFTGATLLTVASLMGIPTMIHEQNAYPGRSNRLTGKLVDKVGISFLPAQDYFDPEKTFLAGNPIREVFKQIDRTEARKKLGLKDEEKLIIFMGGSQGAQNINNAAIQVMEDLKDEPVVFYHLTGPDQIDAVNEELEERGILSDKIHTFGYHEDVVTLMAAGDLIVCRSGASTVAEICACGIPAIFIPFPKAAGDHQSYNAHVLSDSGAAICIPDDQLTGAYLTSLITDLLNDPDRLARMRQKTLSKKITDADERFCKEAIELVERNQKEQTSETEEEAKST